MIVNAYIVVLTHKDKILWHDVVSNDSISVSPYVKASDIVELGGYEQLVDFLTGSDMEDCLESNDVDTDYIEYPGTLQTCELNGVVLGDFRFDVINHSVTLISINGIPQIYDPF